MATGFLACIGPSAQGGRAHQLTDTRRRPSLHLARRQGWASVAGEALLSEDAAAREACSTVDSWAGRVRLRGSAQWKTLAPTLAMPRRAECSRVWKGWQQRNSWGEERIERWGKIRCMQEDTEEFVPRAMVVGRTKRPIFSPWDVSVLLIPKTKLPFLH